MQKTTSALARAVSLAIMGLGVVTTVTPAFGQQQALQDSEQSVEKINVTGSRIARSETTSSSPIFSLDDAQIKLDRAVTVEDIAKKLPQAAGGANSTGATVGDSLGSSTLDLRGLGQNRTLVLINGTRAVPFSFRNAVDVNTIPAGLIKRVDVLTGGAAAIYGADAVSGVVNFVLDDQFDGFEISSSYEVASGGAELFNTEAIFGGDIADGRGHVTGYVGYSSRQELLAGERSFTGAIQTSVPSSGGNYTDVASDNFFSIADDGSFSTTRQTTNITSQRYLVQPLDRYSAGVFYNYELLEGVVEAYGRATFTQIEITGAGSTGQTPISVNEVVSISADNPNIPEQARSLLTFDDDGQASVRVERGLGLGLQETTTVRDTWQVLFGLKGDLTDTINWDVYAQYGRTDGTATVFNNGIRNTSSGASKFANLADSANIFDPQADLSSLGENVLHSNRKRTQTVVSANLFGDSSDVFELPAGAIDWVVGYEFREETGVQTPGSALSNGLAYGLGGISSLDAKFDSSEFYAELLVPLLSDLPFIQELNLEAAYRVSDYSNTGNANTRKLALSWTVNDEFRIRATQNSAIRAPNLGEFAGPEVALSLALFDPNSSSFIPRLGGRFDGDPCLDGRGDQAQCDRQGAAPAGTAFDTSSAVYSFGGNANIKPEEADTYTVGVVYTSESIEGLDITLDYYDIEITDAVSQIQPISALTSCYIDNPDEGNPLCGAVLRDATTGLISQTLVNDFNLATLSQSGFDLNAYYTYELPEDLGDEIRISYQGNFVTDQTRQNNATVPELDCKGTFGTSCTGDFASILQADYKHRLLLDWNFENIGFQLSWRRIGEVENVLNREDKIDAQDSFDFSSSWAVSERVQVTFGIENLLDEAPPLPASNSNLYGTVSDYDVIGRTYGVSIRIR